MKNILSRIKQLDTGAGLFFGSPAVAVVVVPALSALSHQETTEMSAGPANCAIDSAHVQPTNDGSMIVLKGAIIECDRIVGDSAKARFTVKSQLLPLGEMVKRLYGRD